MLRFACLSLELQRDTISSPARPGRAASCLATLDPNRDDAIKLIECNIIKGLHVGDASIFDQNVQGVESLHRRGDSLLESATVPTDTQADFADAVNLSAFFLTNSWRLCGFWPVSVNTSSDIRS